MNLCICNDCKKLSYKKMSFKELQKQIDICHTCNSFDKNNEIEKKIRFLYVEKFWHRIIKKLPTI